MNNKITVDHAGNDRFTIDVRGHRLTVDQPVDNGGDDTAPTPTEMFVASMASCVAFYARRYLARHSIDPEGLSVEADFDAGGRPNRITDLAIRVTPPRALPQDRRAAFLAVASGCTLHHTLQSPPIVDITLDDETRT